MVKFVHVIMISLFYCSSSLSIEENVLDNLLNNRYTFHHLQELRAESPSNQEKVDSGALHLPACVDNTA